MNATLEIQVGSKNGLPFLKKIFFTTPFKVMNITENKKGKELHLMLMSSSPGILDGDEYEIDIEVQNHCSLQLHTQAYQRLYNMKQGASQQMTVRLADDAAFCFLPHPSVPHEQSIFTSKNNFHLANNSCLLFGEVLTCGRKLNGEIFLLSKYQSTTHVFVHGKLVIKENLLLQPALINVHSMGQLEGYTHQASMLYLDEKTDVKKMQAQLIQMLAEEKNIEAGITAAPLNGLIIRLLGNGAEQLFDCMQRISHLFQTPQSLQHAS